MATTTEATVGQVIDSLHSELNLLRAQLDYAQHQMKWLQIRAIRHVRDAYENGRKDESEARAKVIASGADTRDMTTMKRTRRARNTTLSIPPAILELGAPMVALAEEIADLGATLTVEGDSLTITGSSEASKEAIAQLLASLKKG